MKDLKTIYKFKNFIKVEKYYLKKLKIKNFHRIHLAHGCMAIIQKENRILITKEYRAALNSFSYGLPGGMLENNENKRICLKREVREELGLRIKIKEKIFEYTRNGNYGCGKDYVFLCEPKNDKIITEKGIFYDWKNYKQILNMIIMKKFKTPGVITALMYFMLKKKIIR